MHIKRIGRTLICLLMVCALLVNVSPIRAEASVLGGIITVEAAKAVGSVLIGLGIGVGASVVAFDVLTNSAIGQMISDGVPITDGKIDLYALGDGKYGMKGSLLQSLFDWLWADSGVFLDPGVRISSTVRDSILKTLKNYASNSSTGHAYALFGFSISNNRITKMAVSRQPFVLESDGKYYSYEDGYKIYVNNFDVYSAYVGGSDSNSNYARISGDDFVIYSGTELGFDVAVNGDLTTNFIANPGLSLAEGYPAWHQNAVVITGDDSIGDIYYPIALGTSLEETQSMTQEQVWAGEGTYVDTGSGTITVPETVTLKDIFTAIISIPEYFAGWFEDVISWGQSICEAIAAIPQAIPAAISDALTWAFAPSETFIQSKVEALIAKYPTTETFSHLGHSFRSFFDGLGAQPPIIYIDLGASEGDYNYGGRMAFIDLTWYARYKPTVDAILGAFIWLWVAWRFFVSIPGIISGAPGIFGSPNEKPDVEFHAPRFEVGKNWLNSGSSYHKKGDGGGV